MNESFADLTLFDTLDVDQDPTPFLRTLNENTVKGWMYSPVTGGGTASVEFEYLTGFSTIFQPPHTVAYQLYVEENMPSLAALSRACGYATTAFHPYKSSGWNRPVAYDYLDFDHQLYEEDVKDPWRIRSYVSDLSDYERIYQVTEEANAQGLPAFVFNVTMQNHSGYSQGWKNLERAIQVGSGQRIADPSAGKTGFITAMYIVIVPLFGLFQGKRPTVLLWISVAVAAGGLYFLCVTESFTVAPSDLIVLLCAVLYAGHILVVDRFSGELDGIQMSCIQFFTAMVLAVAGAFAMETPSVQALSLCVWPILYCGLLSSGVGYTLQILAQKDANPTVVSILLSMESVFAVIGGAVVLHERMGGREILGCVLMMIAVILAQLPASSKEKVVKAEE